LQCETRLFGMEAETCKHLKKKFSYSLVRL